MGQQASKSHAPLTFGYINQNTQQEETLTIEQQSSGERYSADFVLANPHLYKLETKCHYCFVHRLPSTSKVTVADQVDSQCKNCQKNKRLSLVRRDLASDLNYIDETYYPNTLHYSDDSLFTEELSASAVPESIQDENDTEDEESPLETEEGWSKLTMGEIAPSTPKRLTPSNSLVVDLSGRSLIKLSSSIGYLNTLTKLDLSNNQMATLPKAIGKLRNLRILNASKNQLESIPDTLIHLSKLKAINLSQNKLSKLPKGIGQLPNLIIILLDNNQFSELPREIANLNELMTLNVSHNPLKTIPAEITALKSLKKLLTEHCPFEEEMSFPLLHDPPSLLELCARAVVQQKINLPSHLLHPSIMEYFKKEQTCSFCHGPYFDAYVTRGRFIERMGRQIIALDYRLCCAHWSNEDDRLAALFSSPYHTPQPIRNHEIGEMPSTTHQDADSEQEDDFKKTTGNTPHPPGKFPNSSSHQPPLMVSSLPSLSILQTPEHDTTRPRSSSASLQLTHHDTNVYRNEDQEQCTSQRVTKYNFPANGIKHSFAQFGSKLRRERSDTV